MSYRWPTMPNTGEADVWKGVSGVVSAGTDVYNVLEDIKAENQIAEFKRRTSQIDLELADQIEREPDSDKYKKFVQEADARKSKYMPTSPRAQRFATQILDAQKQSNTELLYDAQLRREKDNYKAGIEKDINAGRFSLIETNVRRGIKKGFIGKEEAERLVGSLGDLRRKAELNAALQFALRDPQGAKDSINADKMDGFVLLEPSDIERVQSTIARQFAKQKEQLEFMQDQVGQQMLVDLWNGSLTDIQDVTDALDKSYLTTTMAKYLRDEMLEPYDPTPTEALMAEAAVRDAVNSYHADIDINPEEKDKTNKQKMLEILYSHAKYLGKEKGSSLLSAIYEKDPDKATAQLLVKAKNLMEEYIRTKDPFSGMFTDNKPEIAKTSEALLLLDIEMEASQKRTGKPMGRRDIMIAAMEIGQDMRKELDAVPKDTEVPVPSDLGMTVTRSQTMTDLKPGVEFRLNVATSELPRGTVLGTVNSKGGVDFNKDGAMRVLEMNDYDPVKARA